MARAVGVQVVASPRLLHDVVAHSLLGDGVEIAESDDSLVSVVTPDHVNDVRSKIVIVLGESTVGDVHVLVDGIRVEDRDLDAGELHRFVLELAERVTHNEPTICAPRTPLPPAAETIDAPKL